MLPLGHQVPVGGGQHPSPALLGLSHRTPRGRQDGHRGTGAGGGAGPGHERGPGGHRRDTCGLDQVIAAIAAIAVIVVKTIVTFRVDPYVDTDKTERLGQAMDFLGQLAAERNTRHQCLVEAWDDETFGDFTGSWPQC